MSLINRLIDANDYNAAEHWLHGDEGFFMVTLTPKDTGLALYLSMDDTGSMSENGNHRSDNTPRIWVHSGYNTKYLCEAIVTIEAKPKIIIQKCVKPKDNKKIKEAIDYISRNYDIFLKHYLATENYDNGDMFDDLKTKGELKK